MQTTFTNYLWLIYMYFSETSFYKEKKAPQTTIICIPKATKKGKEKPTHQNTIPHVLFVFKIFK